MKFRVWDTRLNSYSKELFFIDKENCLFIFYKEELVSIPARELNNYIIEYSTDICDKNDKEIYEGDIIVTEVKRIEIISRSCLCFRAEFKFINDIGNAFEIFKPLEHPFGLMNSKIIGNIHENPELLENKA